MFYALQSLLFASFILYIYTSNSGVQSMANICTITNVIQLYSSWTELHMLSWTESAVDADIQKGNLFITTSELTCAICYDCYEILDRIRFILLLVKLSFVLRFMPLEKIS